MRGTFNAFCSIWLDIGQPTAIHIHSNGFQLVIVCCYNCCLHVIAFIDCLNSNKGDIQQMTHAYTTIDL